MTLKTLHTWLKAWSFALCAMPLVALLASQNLPENSPLVEVRDTFSVVVFCLWFVVFASYIVVGYHVRIKNSEEESE